MKNLKFTHVMMIALLCFVTAASAQRQKFEVKFNGVVMRANLNTPVFSDKIDAKSPVATEKWGLIMAEYEVKFNDVAVPRDALDDGKWLDDVKIKWEFLHKRGEVNDLRKLGKFTRTVSYTGIGEGKHRICLFISPVNMKRYFNGGALLKDVWMRMSMKVNGYTQRDFQIIRIGGQKPDPAKLARYHELFDTDRTKAMKHILVRRDESPFRSIQFDLFDTIVKDEE